MVLVALSTVISVVTVNFRYRRGSAYKMSPWVRTVFLNCLPKLLMMSRPEKTPKKEEHSNSLVDASALIAMPALAYPIPNTEIKHKKKKFAGENLKDTKMVVTEIPKNLPPSYEKVENTSFSNQNQSSSKASKKSPDPKKVKQKVNDLIFMNLIRQVKFIAEHFRRNEEESEEANDWMFLSMVLDRLFLIIFSILNAGAFLVILQAPSLYDTREPLNITAPTKPLGQANIHSLRAKF